MKRAFALVLATLALAYAQEADPKASLKPSTEAKPEPAAAAPEGESIQKPRKPMLKVRACVPACGPCDRGGLHDVNPRRAVGPDFII